MQVSVRKLLVAALSVISATGWVPLARPYAFDQIVPDVRQSASVSGGSACPVKAHQLTAEGSVTLRWSTALNTSPVTILTVDQTAAGRLNEIEQVISASLATWTGVSGTMLVPSSLAPLTRVSPATSCGTDGINSICFDQPDAAFTPGVLAFTRVVAVDVIGEQTGVSPASSQLGQILDADIYFNPSDSRVTFATPAALASNPSAYDLDSVLTHELGHFLGFSHSAIWSAKMYPFAPAPGTFLGARSSAQQPDAPLGDDDRTGLRILYPDASDTVHVGSIAGRILPANPLSLPTAPPNVTGIFGAHVVAVDAASGAVIGATIGGWSCPAPGPAQFDGSYEIDKVGVGHSYTIYAEPLNGVVPPSLIAPAITTLCRNAATDPGWPAQESCVVPAVNIEFTTRSLPAP